MDIPPADAPKDLAGLREWLMQLERRVDELEAIERVAQRRRRRSLWLFAFAAVLYLVLFSYLTQSIPG